MDREFSCQPVTVCLLCTDKNMNHAPINLIEMLSESIGAIG